MLGMNRYRKHTTILAYAHITLSPFGIPYISNTRTKVEEVVLDHFAYHWDAEEMQRQPPHLTLGQICEEPQTVVTAIVKMVTQLRLR